MQHSTNIQAGRGETNEKYAWNNEKSDGICCDLWLAHKGALTWWEVSTQADAAEALFQGGPTHWAAVRQQHGGTSRTKLPWITQGPTHPVHVVNSTWSENRVQGEAGCQAGPFLFCNCTTQNKKQSSISWVPPVYTVPLEITGWWRKLIIHLTLQIK